jgi:hypothetical protein
MNFERLRLVAFAVTMATLLVVDINCAPKEPKVIDGSGRLPSWVTEVWRDNMNGITCWGDSRSNGWTCFRDKPECLVPQKETAP